MRRISLGYIALMIFLVACDTAGNVDQIFRTYFIKYYGEDGNQEGVDMLVNADGTIVLLGNTAQQTNPGVYRPFVVKVDPEGNVLWQRELGELGEQAVDVELDNNQNLIVVSNIGSEASSRVRIFRIDQGGNGIDSLVIAPLPKQVAKSVTVLSNNFTLIAGYTSPAPGRNPGISPSPADESDWLILQLDQSWTTKVLAFGGEHFGSAAKVFEGTPATQYYVCGDSDRPLQLGVYNWSFEVFPVNDFGNTRDSQLSGSANEVQTVSKVIATPASIQEGYLMVGTSSNDAGTPGNIYITQYTKGLVTKRLDFSFLLRRRLQGISAAVGAGDKIFIVANETLDANNNRDIFLLKTEGDGAVIDSYSFGTVEGDDRAAAVNVLPDERVAVLGTMELETQTKLVLIVMNQNGKFSN